MKRFFAVAVLVCSLASGYAQTKGMIECNGRSSVSAFEEPGSIIVIEQLSCGQILEVMGEEEGHIKVQTRKHLFAYVPAGHIRFLEENRMTGQVVREPVPEDEPVERKDPPLAVPSIPLSSAPDKAAIPLTRSNLKSVLKAGIEIGLDSSCIRYEEPEIMEEEGLTLSLYGTGTLRPKDFMVRFDGRMGFGSVDYRSPISGKVDGIRDYIMEARFLFGRTVKASDKWYLTPFYGLGYRYLFDGLNEKVSSVGHLGYDRRSHYLYSPIGIESVNYLNYRWSLVAAAEYDYFWHGWQYSDLGALYGDDSSVLNHQKNGWGLRASGKIIKEAGSYNVVIGPSFKYWNIDDSSVTSIFFDGEEGTVIEPANTSIEIGGMFGVIF